MENKTIGILLREARESKNLTIEEVAAKTKININILRNLESDKIDKLPNKTYVRGFVKNYARLVGVTAEDSVEALDRTYGETQALSNMELAVEENEDSGDNKQKREESEEIQDNLKSIINSLINKKALYAIGTLIVLIIVVKSLGAFFSQLSNEQVKIVKIDKQPEAKPNTIKEDDKIEEVQVDVKKEEEIKRLALEKAEKEKAALEKAAIEKANKEAKEKAEKEKRIALEKAKREKELQNQNKDLKGKYPYIKFYSAPKNMFTIVKDAPENNDTEILPARFKNAIIQGQENVYIKAHSGDTWVSYQADEDKIKRFVLKQGRSVLIKANKILLFMGNVSVAKIFYNNQLINTPTKSGVKSLIFPQSLAQDYQLPLFPSYKGIPIKADLYRANMAEKID